ncbi:MAG: hypothetical protein WBM97_19205, partial [Sedimenticolaceae bacterium]
MSDLRLQRGAERTPSQAYRALDQGVKVLDRCPRNIGLGQICRSFSVPGSIRVGPHFDSRGIHVLDIAHDPVGRLAEMHPVHVIEERQQLSM